MQHNCIRHFKAPLELLEPTIIVLQGGGVRKWMKAAFDNLTNAEIPTIQIGNCAARVLAFSHPSAHGTLNWGVNDQTSYLRKTVVPRVQEVLDERIR